jgi:hypothetical protein
MPVLKKPNAPVATPAKAQPVAKAQPAAAKSKPMDAFGQRLSEIDAKEGRSWNAPLPGTYNALIVEAQGVTDNLKQAAYLEVIIADEEPASEYGKKCRIYWNFFNDKGEENTDGMAYFKSAFAMLGYETPTTWDGMCEDLAAMAAEGMWVIITVAEAKKSTKAGAVNVYLDSVPDNQDEKPAMPTA